jgi:integrase
MEEALYDVPLYREFAGLGGMSRLPDRVSIMRFRQMVEHVPLPSEVGEAIATYLRDGRGASASRHVFLRRLAPRVGLAGPAAIGKIVCQAFAHAGFRAACRGAAHLFRHGLATTMIRHGASMAEIAEVPGVSPQMLIDQQLMQVMQCSYGNSRFAENHR